MLNHNMLGGPCRGQVLVASSTEGDPTRFALDCAIGVVDNGFHNLPFAAGCCDPVNCKMRKYPINPRPGRESRSQAIENRVGRLLAYGNYDNSPSPGKGMAEVVGVPLIFRDGKYVNSRTKEPFTFTPFLTES